MRAVMVLSFLVNWLLIMGTRRLAGSLGEGYRTVGAAALGAAYAGGCLVPGFGFLGGLHWRAASLGLMSALAFGVNRQGWKQGGIFTLLTMALGGMALAFGEGGSWPVVLSALGIRALSQFSLGGWGRRRLLPVEITGDGKTLRLFALQDTGNTLRDPITGERVLVVDAAAAEMLTGLTKEQLGDPLDTITRYPGLRLIPYETVGRKGMLLARRFPGVRIGGKEQSGVVAFAPQTFGEEYQALAGGML